MPKKLSEKIFEEKIKNIHTQNNIVLLPEQAYQGIHHYYRWECCLCGHQWKAPLSRIEQGHGCPNCKKRIVTENNSVSINEFLEKLNKRNLQNPPIKYVSGFSAMTKKALFQCQTCNHQWETLPKSIIRGSGCPQCAKKQKTIKQRYSHQEFLEKLEERNQKYLNAKIFVVPNQLYFNSKTKVMFTCENNHIWSARPSDILNKDIGCPVCSGVSKRTFQQVIEQIKQKWPLLTVISEHGDFVGRREYIEVQCENNHIWKTTYERLITGHYCPHCYGNAKYDHETFVKKLSVVSPSIEVIGRYKTAHTSIEVKCKVCNHHWKPRPYNLLQGYGCPTCSKNNKFSKKGLFWLKYQELQHGIEIKHALQHGEFRVPGTKFKVDGYHEQTKTVYEFYGDYWHGNPQKYNPLDYNVHLNKKFGELYQQTIEREQKLKQLGFNVVSIWETDFDNLIKQTFLLEVMRFFDFSQYEIVYHDMYFVIFKNQTHFVIFNNIEISPENDYRYSLLKIKEKYCGQNSTYVVFSDEIKTKTTLVRNKILHYDKQNTTSEKIFARNCVIKETTKQEKNYFLNTNHIQGNDNAQISYGAYYNDKLVAIMTFTKPRVALGQKGEKQKHSNKWELSRFCTDISYRIPGIASKLLKHFQRNHQWEEIYSYADKRWSVGSLYYKLGFKLVADNPPDYFYVVGGVRKHRWNYRKDVLKNMLSNYDPTKTEYQNMVEHGFYRVWDCGTLKFSIFNETT